MGSLGVQAALEGYWPLRGKFIDQFANFCAPAPLCWPEGVSNSISVNLSWFILNNMLQKEGLVLSTSPIQEIDELIQVCSNMENLKGILNMQKSVTPKVGIARLVETTNVSYKFIISFMTKSVRRTQTKRPRWS